MSEHYRQVRAIQPAPDSDTRIRQAGPGGLKGVIAVLSVLVLVFAGIGYLTVGRLGNEVASAGNLSLGGGQGMKKAPDGATDILLVGSDSRTDAQGNPLSQEELASLNAGAEEGEHNTDTIMVIRVPNDGSSATAVSIPRDTYVKDDELGNMKINGAFAAHAAERRSELEAEGADEQRTAREELAAGREGLVTTVAELTGIEVDHYAEIGLLGFVLLTDAVGGVDVCLNEPVQDEFSGADFPAGRQTLDGVDALKFVRQRHGLPRGDLDRVTRQQAFMASMVQKLLSAGTLTNPGRLNDLRGAVERSVVIDEDWDVMSFAAQLSNLAGGNVTFTTIPVTSLDGVGDYGESIVTVDPDQVRAFMDDLLGTGEEEQPEDGEAPPAGEPAAAAADAELHVLNAGSVSGLAGSVGGWLEEHGYHVAEVSNALEGIYTESQVVAGDADSEAAKAVAEELGGLPVTVNEGLDADTLVVVTHDDYAGPQGDQMAEAPSGDGSVGQPGVDFGTEPEASPEIDAGGDGPRCVN